MARASAPDSFRRPPPTIYNEGASTVSVGVRVHSDGVTTTLLVLAPGESQPVSAPRDGTVEVYTRDGSATALAADGPSFSVRDGRVLVAPE